MFTEKILLPHIIPIYFIWAGYSIGFYDYKLIIMTKYSSLRKGTYIHHRLETLKIHTMHHAKKKKRNINKVETIQRKESGLLLIKLP